MKRTLRVLHVEDSERDVALLTRYLSLAGYDLTSERVETPEAMRAALAEREWDVILCDFSMPNFNAPAALRLLKETGLDIPFIIISGTVGEETAVEAMRAGANDYLLKDNLARLAPAIERGLEEARNRRARARAEAELLKSETQYRRLLETSYEGVWMFDAEMRTTYVNRRMAEMLGVSPEEMRGRPASDFLGEAERAEVERRWRRRAEGVREQYDLRLRRGDGSDLWVITCATPVYDERGEFIGSLSMMTDITERKRAEEELRETARSKAESLALLDIILSTAPIGFAFHNRDLRFELVNEMLAEVNGLPVEEHLGRTLREVLPEIAEAVEPIFRRVLETSEPVVDIELSGETPSDPGRLRHWLASFYPVRTRAGEALGVGVLLSEVTERKRAEEELRESEERYRLLFESNPTPMWVYDLETLRFLTVNDAAVHRYGYSREEFLSMTIKDIRPREDVPALLENVSRVGGGLDEAGVWRHRIKGGQTVDVEIASHALTFAGRRAELVMAHDVSERRSLEEQLRQAQKMEAVGQLAGGIAHDFNNLLTAINGYSDLALRLAGEEEALRRNIEEVKKAGERAAALTRQLLAFSRKQVLQPVTLDLNVAVSDSVKMLTRLIGEDIELRTALAPDLGSVKADPGQMDQVLVNLVVNARDAMPRGGKLNIETGNVYFDEDYARHHIEVAPGPYVMLAVSDTGVGMDAETRARVFEPFFTTKEQGKGTGLGLSTVYGIVKQSGGGIWVYSEVGRGTTFKIYLPRVDEGARGHKPGGETEATAGGAETILLVEDEETVRGLARQVLEMLGYRVLEAAGGGAALSTCERHEGPIQLLVTDVVMPGMSGPELAERLTRLRPDMRVLFMSGYTDDAIVHHGILEEGVSFIEKPFSLDALARKVREVLDAPK